MSGAGRTGGGDGDGGDPELGALLARLAAGLGPGGMEVDGDRVRLDQAPEKNLEVRIIRTDDDGTTLSVASAFSPSEERPPDFPPGLPFVPGCAVHVIEDHHRGLVLAMWRPGGRDAPSIEDVAAGVIGASREDGWAVEAGGEPGSWQLRRAGRSRRVQLRQRTEREPLVSLSDRPG